jgi:dienelactone hydrolase
MFPAVRSSFVARCFSSSLFAHRSSLTMLSWYFHRWERQLADVSKDRVVRPFEWGLDWLPEEFQSASSVRGGGTSVPRPGGLEASPPRTELETIRAYVRHVLADTSAWFTPPPTDDYEVSSLDDGTSMVTFPTARPTPHHENDTVVTRFFPARNDSGRSGPRRAVLVLPQWNSDGDGHVGLCQLLARFGMSALRLSLPYHDRRMPAELQRADYIVSSNIVRTLEVCRQAVLDARRAIAWLARSGYERIGILGTSLGSCLSMLTACHEPLIRAQALNHISPYFADVVWRGLSTRHVRAGLDGHIDLETLRDLWMPISPQHYLDRLKALPTRTLLVYARYDLTFPVDLSRELVGAFRGAGIPHQLSVLPCGHYSTGSAPFKYMDGAVLTRFLYRHL